MEQSYKVHINIYDITQGMARNLSPMFLGKLIDGVWHTGVVVYGKEYYFGGGICNGPPSQTPFGTPTKNEYIGETQIPPEVFHDFLKDISPKFSMTTYDILKNNCNNFADECCQFLTGISIPSYITGLPSEILRTPLGKMIEPIINNLQRQITAGSQDNQVFPQMLGGDNNLNFNNSNPQNNNGEGHKIIEIRNFEDFFEVIERTEGVVIDFYSLSCPPCQMIKPIFAEIAENNHNKNLVFCCCDVNVARDVASQLEIQSIPTFCFYYKLDLIHRFSGANQTELREQIEKLRGMVSESQEETNKIEEGIKNMNINEEMLKNLNNGRKYKLCDPSQYQYFLYKTDKFDFPVGKIRSMDSILLRNKDCYDTFLEFASNSEHAFKYFVKEKKKELLNFLIENMKSYLATPANESVPFFDLFRIFIAEEGFAEVLADNFGEFINELLELLEKERKKEKEIVRTNRVLILRALCNLFVSENSRMLIVNKKKELIEIIKNLMVNQGKNDKLIFEGSVMLYFNIVLNDFEIFKNDPKETIKDLTYILNQENASDDTYLGGLLSLNYLCFKDKDFLDLLKEQDLKSAENKLKLSKSEKIVYALQDLQESLSDK